jgi:hypothetical protein
MPPPTAGYVSWTPGRRPWRDPPQCPGGRASISARQVGEYATPADTAGPLFGHALRPVFQTTRPVPASSEAVPRARLAGEIDRVETLSAAIPDVDDEAAGTDACGLKTRITTLCLRPPRSQVPELVELLTAQRTGRRRQPGLRAWRRRSRNSGFMIGALS